jgi:hypothetical protein
MSLILMACRSARMSPAEGAGNMFGKHHSVSGSVPAQGVIMQWAPSSLYRTKVRLVVGVKFDDGQKVEFTEEITDFCLPGKGGVLAAIGADPIPLPLTEGSKIPVRYDPGDRRKMWIDEDTLHEAAISKHAEAAERKRARAEAILDSSQPQPHLYDEGLCSQPPPTRLRSTRWPHPIVPSSRVSARR